MRFCIGTWNLQGADPGYVTLNDIVKWLKNAPRKETAKNPFKEQIPDIPCDVYAIGLQEVIPMDKSVRIPVPKVIFKGGNNLDISRTSIRDKILWAWSTLLVNAINSFEREAQYSLFGAYLLNGVCLFLIVRNELINFGHIKNGRADTVRADNKPSDLEIMLLPDNKANGAVGIRFECGGSSIAIINSHLKDGEGVLACAERNKQYNKIAGEMFRDAGMSLNNHEYVFWMGDLNYRVCGGALGAPTPGYVWEFEKRGELNSLLQADELTTQMSAGTAFQGYREGMVQFPPNYPYQSFMDRPGGRPDKRPGAFAKIKKRDYSETPSWTERILWRRNNNGEPKPPGFDGGLAAYALAEDVGKVSQHLPIVAVIDVEIKRAPQQQILQPPRRPDMFVQGRPLSPGPMFQAAPQLALPAPQLALPAPQLALPAPQLALPAPQLALPATQLALPVPQLQPQQLVVEQQQLPGLTTTPPAPLPGFTPLLPAAPLTPALTLQQTRLAPLNPALQRQLSPQELYQRYFPGLAHPFNRIETPKEVFDNFILPSPPVL